MQKNAFESYFDERGATTEHAPRWSRVRSDIRSAFPSYYNQGAVDPLAIQFALAIQKLNGLKQAKNGPGFLGSDPSGPHYETCSEAEVPRRMQELGEVVDEVVRLFEGLPNYNHPLVMPNVAPQPNLAALIGALMAQIFNPNLIEGEYAWNVEVAELESAAMLARLVGWDPRTAGGFYTFGGSGCYLYGLKYALTQVFGPESRKRGIRTDAKLLVSQQGHYCSQNATDWSGLGTDNVIQIETDVATNAMNLWHLERVLADLHERGIPVVSVVCTVGSTDAFAVDNVAEVRRLLDRYPNPPGYGPAFLYCDAVIGWSWLTFKDYDFAENPLGFSARILPVVKYNVDLIKDVVHADALGCDFHKVGWAPYNCSLFLVRDQDRFRRLMERPFAAYLQERTDYNPGQYTLEVSRSPAYATAGWATLKFFGIEGFQAVLGGILEMSQYLRDCIEEIGSMVCVNSADHGFATLFRVYPSWISAPDQYMRELTNPEARDELIRHNQFQVEVADVVYSWFRDGRLHAGSYAPYITYTSGFRPAAYNDLGRDELATIYALKSFPMNLNIDPSAMRTMLEVVLAARDEVVSRQ